MGGTFLLMFDQDDALLFLEHFMQSGYDARIGQIEIANELISQNGGVVVQAYAHRHVDAILEFNVDSDKHRVWDLGR